MRLDEDGTLILEVVDPRQAELGVWAGSILTNLADEALKRGAMWVRIEHEGLVLFESSAVVEVAAAWLPEEIRAGILGLDDAPFTLVCSWRWDLADDDQRKMILLQGNLLLEKADQLKLKQDEGVPTEWDLEEWFKKKEA